MVPRSGWDGGDGGPSASRFSSMDAQPAMVSTSNRIGSKGQHVDKPQ